MIEKQLLGNPTEKLYTQDEVNKLVAETYERAKREDAKIIAKYNALRRILKDVSTVFEGD